MPSWGEILKEVSALAPTDPSAVDTTRRKYIQALQAHTGRATILYASRWMQPGTCEGLHSSLGPIDPQMVMQTPLGVRMVPAQAILDQFDKAQEDCKNPAKLGSWMPILGQYGPALLIQCDNALKLSKHLVKAWLAQYMFVGLGRRRAAQKAALVARGLADHRLHMSHGRHFDRARCQSMGFNITALESDQRLQDLVLSVFHATAITFTMSTATKIIENNIGRAFIKLAVGQIQLVPQSAPGEKPGVGVPIALPTPVSPSTP
ncbi:MAG: hypothetical protein HY552_02905 [Elusimicrobia bacterium]|nr:hypothetical protein [Elusimicrobiota bacterium]